MADLSRWLPFKSRRKTQEQKQASETTAATGEGPLAQQGLSTLMSTPMQQLMQRMFDEPFLADPFARFGDLDRWFGDFSPARFRPSVDVVDEEGAVRVTAELPGMEKDNLQLSVDNNILTIRGEKRNEEEKKEQGVFRTERYYGYVQRAVPLPADLDIDKTEAEFKSGVLTIRVPKGAKRKETGTRIPIKS